MTGVTSSRSRARAGLRDGLIAAASGLLPFLADRHAGPVLRAATDSVGHHLQPHREGFHTIRDGGLNWESFPLKLFVKGNRKFWDPTTSTSAATPPTGRR